MSPADIIALARLAHRAPVRLVLTDEHGTDHVLVIQPGSTPEDVRALLEALNS